MKKSVLLFVLGICGTAVFAQDANVKSQEIKSGKAVSTVSNDDNSSLDIIQKKKIKMHKQAVFVPAVINAKPEEMKAKQVEK